MEDRVPGEAEGTREVSRDPVEYWSELFAAGVIELGLTAAEFWRMTPAMFRRLWKRYEAKCQREKMLADARIMPLTLRVLNYLRAEGTSALKPGDLFPSLGEPSHFPTMQELEAGRRQTEERLARIEAGLPVEDVQIDSQTAMMMQEFRNFQERKLLGETILTREPITKMPEHR